MGFRAHSAAHSAVVVLACGARAAVEDPGFHVAYVSGAFALDLRLPTDEPAALRAELDESFLDHDE